MCTYIYIHIFVYIYVYLFIYLQNYIRPLDHLESRLESRLGRAFNMCKLPNFAVLISDARAFLLTGGRVRSSQSPTESYVEKYLGGDTLDRRARIPYL